MRKPTGHLVGALVALFLVLPASPALANHAGPLQGQWHFDEDECPMTFRGATPCTPDSSGHGFNATSSSGVFDLVPGRFGLAFTSAFDAHRSLNVVPSGLLEPSAVTALAWVRRPDSPGGSGFVVAKGATDTDQCGPPSYALWTGDPFIDNPGGMFFTVRAGGLAYDAPGVAPEAVWDGNWHMVAGTFDGGTARFYLDGVQIGNGTIVPGPIDYAVPFGNLTIGAYPLGDDDCHDGGGFLDADIDEGRVYNRALSAAEIARLASAQGAEPPVLVPDTPNPGGNQPPPLPVPRFTTAKSLAMKRATWMNAKTSFVPPGVTIDTYEWDFNNDGRYDATCLGDSPAISHAFVVKRVQSAVNFNVKLRMTDNLDRPVTVSQPIKVFPLPKKVTPFDKSVKNFSACEKPSLENRPSRGDCQTQIDFSIVDVRARGNGNCFHLDEKPILVGKKLASTSQSDLGTEMRFIATIKGPVAINGLPIPLPGDHTSRFDSGTREISIGEAAMIVTLPGGKEIRVAKTNLDMTVVPKGGEFPLAPLTVAGRTDFAGLKLAGALSVKLVDKAAKIDVRVGLPNFLSDINGDPIQGSIQLRTSSADGFELTNADILVPEAFLGAVVLRKVSFKYQADPGGDLLRAGAAFEFPTMKIAADLNPTTRGIGFRGGNFEFAGVGIGFNPPRPQLFPFVELRQINGSFAVGPPRFSGGVGITAAGLFGIDGGVFIASATPGQPYTIPPGQAPAGLEFLEGRYVDRFVVGIGGTANLIVDPIGEVPLGNGHAVYIHPGFFELGGTMDVSSPPFFSFRGGVDGWIALNRGRFNLEGFVEGCIGLTGTIPPFDIEVDLRGCEMLRGIVSTKGIGFCIGITLPDPFADIKVGIGYEWGDILPGFSVLSCGIGDYREARPAAANSAQAGSHSFTLKKGLPSAQIRVRGEGAPPTVIITGPGGQRIEMPAGDGPGSGENAIIIPSPEENTTYIALRKPRAGRYTVTAQEGSSPIRSVAAADGLPDPKVRARVSGRGYERVLHYKVKAASGQAVTFVEQGSRTYRVIGRARGSNGRIRFSPADGARGRRKIVALVDRGGVTQYSLDVARFNAPGPRRPARPGRLRVKRGRKALTVSWRRAAGARQYGVTLQLSNGQRVFRLIRRRRVKFPPIHALARGSVTVRGLSANGVRGPAAKKKLRRAASRRQAGRRRRAGRRRQRARGSHPSVAVDIRP